MCYSIEPGYRRYVKGYGFLSLAEATAANNEISKERYISPKEKQQVTADLIAKSCPKMKLIMKYQKKDIYLQKKDNKLLIN